MAKFKVGDKICDLVKGRPVNERTVEVVDTLPDGSVEYTMSDGSKLKDDQTVVVKG